MQLYKDLQLTNVQREKTVDGYAINREKNQTALSVSTLKVIRGLID